MAEKGRHLKKRKKKNRKRRILLFVFAAIIFGVVYYGYHMLNKIDYVPIDEDKDLGISDDAPVEDEITNILLFGLDSRVEGQRSRSDTIMIATLDSKENKIK